MELDRKEISKLNDEKKRQADRYENQISKLNTEKNELKAHSDSLNTQLEESLLLRAELVDEKAQIETQLLEKQQQLESSENHINELKNSRSWRYTKPIRQFTTYARHKRNALRFRLSQVKNLPKRIVNSLRSRGFKQTALMAKNKLKKPDPQQHAKAQKVKLDFEPFNIQSNTDPQVSIIIPVFNQFKHTYHCLESISQLNEKTPFEVIVIDDCSTDDTELMIKKIKGIKYHRQTLNGGFIESCNTGAQLAKGQYLLFLNNDTEVLDGWLDELLNTFQIKADAGLVGSQLLYPDGRLQEAGGIVFSDASGWNYGRLGSPDEPEYQHLREATYISGASIMVKRELFESLGRFDERYKPAYYEDTDFGFFG